MCVLLIKKNCFSTVSWENGWSDVRGLHKKVCLYCKFYRSIYNVRGKALILPLVSNWSRKTMSFFPTFVKCHLEKATGISVYI